MERSSSIVLSREGPNYRRIAQLHWGLTDEQMKGMHIHHFPPRSQGGRNIPEHLYVCSESMHFYGWHDANPRLGVTLYSSARGKAVHSEKDELGRSVRALKNLHRERTEDGKSARSVKMMEDFHREKDDEGKSIFAKSLMAKNIERNPLHQKEAARASAEKRMRPVMRKDLKTGEIFRYESAKATESDGFTAPNVRNVCYGKKKQHKGSLFWFE